MTQNTEATVTEAELLKSLQALDPNAKVEPEKKEDSKVVTAALTKTAATAVKEQASDTLKKALEVSGALDEFAKLIGAHVDTALGELAKSVDASAQRDLAFLNVMKSFSDRLEALSKSIDAFGKQPGALPAAAKTAEAKTEVLEKGAKAKFDPKDPAQVQALRKSITTGLETLAKSATVEEDRHRLVQAAVKFESTGVISAELQQRALAANTPRVTQ